MIINNAADTQISKFHKFMIVGQAGSGKSKLATTLPGRTFAWVFDPSAETAYAGCDWIDYSSYKLDLLDLTPYSLSKEANARVQKIGVAQAPTAYTDFAKDFNEAWSTKLYDSYDNIILDSATSFQDAAMDAVLWNNKRFGKVPQQDDYPAQMALFLRNMRSLTSLEKNIYVIFHDTLEQDGATKKMTYIPIITGKNRAKVPNLFNHLLRCSAKQERNNVTNKMEPHYLIQTTPDSYCPGVRTAFEGLDTFHDVTIPQGQFKNARNFGLGTLMKGESNVRP